VTQAAPLPGLPPAAPATAGRAAGRRPLAPEVWDALLAHQPTRDRFDACVYQRGPDQCWYWLGPISDTGHGKFRAGTRTGDGPDSTVVTAHVYGYRRIYGPPPAPGRAGTPVIAHRCDETSCENPAHWRPGSTADNAAEYIARRGRGPLADNRGPAGRARAIRDAIKAAIAQAEAAGLTPALAAAAVEVAIEQASAAGLPQVQGELF
jgi:hypothetical protein